MPRVSEIMTSDPVVVEHTESLRSVATRMRDDGIGAVLVNEQGKLYGIVTDRDITVRAVAEGIAPDEGSVDTVCTHEVEAVSPDDDAGEVIRMMRERGVRRIPVVEDDVAVGIVSLADLAAQLDPDSALADVVTKRL